jgi:putative ABC transport system substrate-binding protein
MRRARVAALLVAAFALLAPGAAHAQARAHPVGVIMPGGPYAQALVGLREGLRELGFDEGTQYSLLVRETKGDLKAAATLAKSLEADKVDVILALGSSTAFATMQATQRVPIVFHSGADPVGLGLVENYRKPGGRLTGVSSQSRALAPKRLELLKEMLPTVRRVIVFYNPDNPTMDLGSVRDAGRSLKIQLIERHVRSAEELRAALRAIKPGEVDAIFHVGESLASSQTEIIIEIALAKRVATMLQDEGAVALGALASYGVSYRAIGQLAARHVHRILLGARPGDLPVERIDRLHFAINLKTAKAIGVTIPASVLARADEIIQ